MRLTPNHERAYEKLWMQFFLARNEWMEVDFASGNHNTSMLGWGMFLILDPALLTGYDTIAQGGGSGKLAGKKYQRLDQTGAGLGNSVHCTSDATPPGTYYAWPCVGVCDDNIQTARDGAEGIWINVQVYGHNENIPIANGTPANPGILYVTGSTGQFSYVDVAHILSPVKLQGAVLIDVAAAGPAVLDLSGANNTQTTWVTPPSLNATLQTISGGIKVPQGYQAVGYKYKEAVVSDVVSGGIYSRARGFINCLAINVGRI